MTIWPGDHQHDPLDHPGEDDPHPDTPNTLRDTIAEFLYSLEWGDDPSRDDADVEPFMPDADRFLAAIRGFAALGGVERLEAAQLLFGADNVREGWVSKYDEYRGANALTLYRSKPGTLAEPIPMPVLVVLSDPARDAPKEAPDA